MNSITGFLSADHQHCDAHFVEAEASVAALRWEQARMQFETFHEALERHFTMEEQVLFPAFEEMTGTSMGPTAVMRREHDQMRDLLRQMQEDLISANENSYLGNSEVLNVMMQQHNLKEESVLYQMCDQLLRKDADELIGKMKGIVDIVHVHY